MFESYRNVLKRGGSHLVTSLRDVIFAVLSGIILGFVGTAFYYGMQFVTRTRLQHPWLIFLLPGAGAAIVGLYQLLHDESGTVRHPLQRKYPTAHGTVNLYCHPADTFIRRFRRS